MSGETSEAAAVPALAPHPAKLFAEVTSRCNLRCSMCLRQSGEEAFRDGDMSVETFRRLLPALATADALVLNGIGEPLLHPHLEEFVRAGKEQMEGRGWVGFQSNGLLMNSERALRLVEAGLDRVCLSLDAVSPEAFRTIRMGEELADVERALEVLRTARIRCRSPLQVGVEFVLRRDNIRELPDAIRWAASLGADFAIVTQLFPYHRDLVPLAVYDANLDSSVAVLDKYAKMGEREGIDIRNYHRVYLKYAKSARDERLIGLVDGMIAEAAREGVTLNLQKLFSMDHGWAERVEETFAAARDAASRAGIRLQLPGVIPRSARRCEFVEEGSVFLSWEGNVHPCYFLWHPFRCYINGMEKIVRPKVFGNITERGILEIWNDPAFVSFRRNVLRYDYPFCFNCSFALCDYVQGGDFEQDCYVNAEPCGVCLWCMDIFNCLK
jgi:putative metalloenzyme radical SAM/SPASM domain maturase